MNMNSNNDYGLNMIRQLANDLYREDLPNEILEQFEGLKTEADGSSVRQYSVLPAESNKLTQKPEAFQRKKVTAESSYYFSPGYQAIEETSHFEGYYYKPGLDAYSIKKDFPILQRRVNGKPLIWLDNSATTQKPLSVINELNRYYSEYNSNIHRGAHTLAKMATEAYEKARHKVQNFIGAACPEEIIFLRGTTEAINLIAESFGGMSINAEDEILLSVMEHHSNIVPWQKLQQQKGAVIKVIPVNDRGEIILDEYERLLSPRTRIVAITHVSNVLGTINPIQKMIQMAHRQGACVLVDGAQSIPHVGVNVTELDADFFAFSGHKVYGPTGIGILYGKKSLLKKMPPWQRGGGMIQNVTFGQTTYNSLPYKFEAGTGNIADAVGLGAAIDYLKNIGMGRVESHEKELTVYAMEKLYQIPGIHLIGTAPDKISVISFIIDRVDPENAAKLLNLDGIAVRSGHHCAQPVLRRFGLNSSIRASLGIYNSKEDIDCLANSILKISKYYN